MAKEVTVKEVHEMLEQHLGNRSDLGLWRAVTNRIMEPNNLLEPESIRRPKRWFVLFSIASLAAIAAFVYFNFLN